MISEENRGNQGFKSNSLVQGILDESLNDESNQSFNPILSRLQLISNSSNISILTENLILTSATCVIPQVIEALDVSCIICAAPELPYSPLSNAVAYHKVNVRDSCDAAISTYFDEVADIIDQETSLGGRVLVFCVAGVSRSATLCLAYLMKYHQLTLQEAYNHVKKIRPRIHPNCGFFQQLIEYEQALFNTTSVKMVFNEFLQTTIPEVYDDEYKQIRMFSRKRRDRQDRHK